MSKIIALFACVLVCSVLHAEVVSVDVTDRQPWVAGRSFGQVGAYEVLRGTVHYAIDPRSVAARDIVDIAFAPVNARGLVEYSGPFLIIRPVDEARGNHTTLVEVANRGATQMDGLFFRSDTGLDLMSPGKVKALTDPTFFTLGYSLAWVGWQGRLNADEFGLRVPVAPVHGAVRATFTAADMTPDRKAYSLKAGGFYCARDARQLHAALRLQTRFDDPGTLVPRASWRFVATPKGANKDARCAISLDHVAGADAHFSVIYTGEDAPVMGLGEAAFRDFAAHLKFRNVPSALNSRPGDAAAIFAYGYSQGGRFLRDFLYRGFNTGPNGKRVFDGLLVVAAGGGRGSFDQRYALPGEAGNSVMSNLRAVDLYPFADIPTPDIDGKGHAGLLDRAMHDGTVPKIMYLFSSTAYWARIGSLVQTTTDGKNPVALGPDSRLYYYSGVPHAPHRPSSYLKNGSEADYPYNNNWDMADGLNAQLENLRAWVVADIAPPATLAPVLGTTLAPLTEIKFPAIPGVRVPAHLPPLWQLHLGPDYKSKGIVSEPPRLGARYPLLVPAVDSDGNELGGWRGTTAAVPLGTSTAWNWTSPHKKRFGFISGLNGAFFPFARTRAERLAANDPRPSIEERYGNREGFMKAVAVAVDNAIAQRFLLAAQRENVLEGMGHYWDGVAKFDWHPVRTVADSAPKQ